jgi:predicted acylesterase/phospholipase RssA
MLKPGRTAKWVRKRIRRLRETRVYRQYIVPMASLLRWEGVILVGAIGFGVVSALATRWFFLFLFLAAAFLAVAWVRAFDEGETGRRFRRRAQWVGLWVWGLLLVLIGTAVFWRFTTWWGATIFAVVYAGIAAWHLRWLRLCDTPLAVRFKQVVALSIMPILLAWFVNSTVYVAVSRVVTAAALRGHDAEALNAVRAGRREAADRWRAGGGAPIAVALSGGGYRAAVVHAGLLWSLDEAGVPVHYLSTVSGGSIVGAAYAGGWSADGFRDRLRKRKPGLTNELVNFYPACKQLLFPRYGSGDTYAAHFDRVFFRGRRLGETGPPLLILNTTRYSDGTRRAFHAEHAADTPLARLVAASGAFPVAFDPVQIGDDSYVDGGVVENLGIAGLQHYFRDHAGAADLGERLPGVLIISDVSLIPDDPPSWKKPSLLQMAIHAQHASYFAMHQWIYSFYTDGAYDRTADTPLEQPYAVEAGRLWPDLPEALEDRIVHVFVLSPASPAERQSYAGHEDLVEAVSAVDTLQELDPDEADAAFWVGARLGQLYVERVRAAAGGPACRVIELPPAPPVP